MVKSWGKAKKARIGLILSIVITLLLFAIPAYAYIVAPTSVTISDVTAFRNLAETGDMLIMFHYSMPYASDNYSETPASESIMLRLYDTDNTTLLQAGVPYVNPFFGSNGYGEGDGSFYLDASEASGKWGTAVVIDISGSPVFFSPSFTKSYTLTTSDYTTETTQEANRDLLKSFILLECDRLAAAYQSTGIVLKATSDIGIVLSPYGELYFRGAVNGLQNLCPDLFFIQSLIPSTMTVETYNTSLMDTYTNRLATDDLGKGFTRMGSLIGTGGPFFCGLLVVIVTLYLSYWAHRKNWGTEVGMLGGAIFAIIMSALVGDVVFIMVMAGSLVGAIGLVWLMFLKKA